jgi:hypothetical protein
MAPETQGLLYDPTVFVDLRVCELWDGWESIENYALIKGVIPVGTRIQRRLRNTARAKPTIAALRECVGTWPAFSLRKPVKKMGGLPGGVAEFVHPLDEHLGFSRDLVALADSICGAGGWCTGRIGMASHASVLAKVRRDEPLALIAPAYCMDWYL